MNRWYRAYEGTVTDGKLAEAAAVADVSRAVAIAAWHSLLESAATVNNCGSYETTARRVSIILCEPTAAVEALFAAYTEIGLIKDGVVLSWRRRQHESDSSTERTRKWREKKRQETAECDGGDGDVTSRDAEETETETETEVSGSKEPSARELWSKPPVPVSKQVWIDFKANRKNKRLGFTVSTYGNLRNDLQRVSSKTGIPPPALIEHAAAQGWGGIYDPNERKGMSHERPDNPTAIAVQRVSGFGAG